MRACFKTPCLQFLSIEPSVLTIDIERKNRLLKVCYVPATSATFLVFFSFFFLAVAINSTNKANKAGGMCHKESISLRCLWC
jgi:hypothetical protein